MHANDIRNIAVIGAGDMGHGIAELCALNGYHVYLKDIDRKFLDRAKKRIRDSLAILEKKGKIKNDSVESILARITLTLNYSEALEDCQLAIEAVPEIMTLKKSVFLELDSNLQNSAVIATNTSNMSITELASQTEHSSQVVGMHFFNPVILMKAVEIIKGNNTSSETMRFAEEFVYSLNKLPIPVLKDIPGFIVNRVQAPSSVLLNKIIENKIATPNQIDANFRKLGQPMGPFELMDYVGLDIYKHGADYFAKMIDPEFKPPKWINDLIDEGKLGKKTGCGIYDWSKGRPAIDLNDSSENIDFKDILLVQVNEAAKLIENGVVEYPGDIDLAIQNATGNVSGIFWLLKDNREYLINRLNYLADKYEIEIFRPNELLKEMPVPSARKALKARKRKKKERALQKEKE
ncbi:MAG: 3-hydroxyacyl-CoA dehydrogenase NAD-binding domain-containing protein [Promethearchaeota archaeon]